MDRERDGSEADHGEHVFAGGEPAVPVAARQPQRVSAGTVAVAERIDT